MCLLLNAGVRAAGDPPIRTVLTVSAADDNFPYSYRDESGHLTGYGVDMLDAVAEVLHVRLERVEVPAEQDIRNLDAGRYDIGQFHASMPRDRANCEYSQSILVNRGDIFVRKGETRFASLDDLRSTHARIATPQQGRDFLLSNGFAPAAIQLSTSTEAMMALSKGQVDAVLLTRLTGLAQAHIHRIRNVEPLGVDLPGFTVSFCIATRKGDVELLGRINEALATLSTTGKTVEIYTRWFGRYESRAPTLRQVLLPATGLLALALLTALGLLRRQSRLRRRIAAQAEELLESRELLAESQHFAQLGHSRRHLGSSEPPVWSDELYRIFEIDPAHGVPSVDQLIPLAIPTDRARWRAAVEQVQKGDAPYEFDVTIEPRPGRRKIVNVRGRVIRNASGQPSGIFGTAQDVTASRTAAAALQQSELLLRALYENLPLALGVLEREEQGWQVASLNPEAVRQLDLPESPLTPCPLGNLGLNPPRLEFWRGQFERCVAAGTTIRFETESTNRRFFAATVVPLFSTGQRPRCCLLSEDITDRRRMDAELAQGQRLRAIGELVGGIAHEFNNLLTPIALNTEFVQSRCGDRPDLQAELAVVADAARRAGELTRRLLTFSRKQERTAETLDLAELVAANIALVRHTIDRRIELRSTVPSTLPPLDLPAGDLHQIVLNLLLNARDALTPKLAVPPAPDWQPTIRISAEQLSAASVLRSAQAPDNVRGYLRLSVTDNGCGMTSEVRERIFEPFFTTKGVGHGTGLGLATTWHLINDFGGRIEVESAPGFGTGFHLYLPLAALAAPVPGDPAAVAAEGAVTVVAPPAAPPPAPLQVPVAPAPSATACLHFLVADDEPSVARIVTRLLTRRGHRVTVVADGHEAWQLLSAKPGDFDAVIMDLNMPGITGIELAHRARALPYAGPLVVVSGKITDEEKAALADIRIDALLNKPFSIADFENAMERARASAAAASGN